MSPSAGSRVEDGWDEVPVDGPETLAERRLLAVFTHRARAVNLARVLRLSELLDRADAGTLDEAGRLEAENLAHQVVGSAGTFGQPGASAEALTVERYFAVDGETARRIDARATTRVRAAVDRLREEFAG